jgi:hypothetical protein
MTLRAKLVPFARQAFLPILPRTGDRRVSGAFAQGDRSRPSRALLRAAVGLALGLAAPAVADEDQSRLLLELEAPVHGAVIGDPQGQAFVSGKALALYGEYQTFDIMFVVDTSHSTADPAGSDIDGDGKVGQRRGWWLLRYFGRLLPLPSNDRGDSVLAAEVQAVRTLLSQLDPRTTRVGLVTFAGDSDPMTLDAYTEVPLTVEYEKIDDALGDILRRDSQGLTNMVAGLNLGMIELLGTQSAYSTPREGSRRIVLFLTDGQPTLPIENSQLQNSKMAIEHAARARKFDIRIDTYAVGPNAVEEPLVTVEMAGVSGGVFTPVTRPGDLRAVFEEITFSDIAELSIRNRTNGATPEQMIKAADGSFSALLKLDEGRNLLELYARATDGSEGRRQIQVSYVPGADSQALDARQLALKNRMLEAQLLELKRRSLGIEADRDAQVRQALRDEIERERKKAQEKAAQARRRLEIEAEK